jgi:hypothetical protein
MNRNWTVAEGIATQIKTILKKEFYEMAVGDRMEPLQLLAGYLMAFPEIEATMPPEAGPRPITDLQEAVHGCLQVLLTLPPREEQ